MGWGSLKLGVAKWLRGWGHVLRKLGRWFFVGITVR
jgi:hypothetical protein